MAMDRGVIYDGVSDVKDIFSSEFRKYILDEKLQCHNYDGGYYSWLFRKRQQLDGVDSAYLDLGNKLTMLVKPSQVAGESCLIQFWKAKEVTRVNNFGERSFILTARDQPFLISGSHFEGIQNYQRICYYRTKMVDNVIGDGRGGGGVIGRVFQNKRVEYTPDIGYYSSEEYPHQDLAISCHIQGSLAIPLSDSDGCSIGVLEIVSTYDLYFPKEILFVIRNPSGLRYLDHCEFLCGKVFKYDLEDKSFKIALSEIKEVMEVVGRTCGLVCAQTWIMCDTCGSLSVCRSLVGDSFNTWRFLEVERLFTFKQEEGFVGKGATSSHNLFYCNNVSEFSITEYPLAHFARLYKFRSCFGIRLRSDLTGSKIYVLEIFINPSKGNGEGPTATLISMLDGMRQNFQTFKVASGEEIGNDLSVRVISAHSPDKTVILRRHIIGESSTYETDVLMAGATTSSLDTSMEESSDVSASTVQSECWLTIKVNHGGELFRFQLSSSSNFLELRQQVSHMLKLEGETYDVKYQDEDNHWILIACDDDVRQCVTGLISQGKYILTVMIEPK